MNYESGLASGLNFARLSRPKIVFFFKTFCLPFTKENVDSSLSVWVSKTRQINVDTVQRAPKPIQFPEFFFPCFACKSSKTRQVKVDYSFVNQSHTEFTNFFDKTRFEDFVVVRDVLSFWLTRAANSNCKIDGKGCEISKRILTLQKIRKEGK